ncbi:MAG: indole-3-glycerol phosphate synthase TrpC [Chloroflexota bacterium]|nr:indole-3-glycerol phosphate synthase TrpC [Chloroflexota bacterium]
MILDRIVEDTRQRVAKHKQRAPLSSIKESLSGCCCTNNFTQSLQGEGIDLIAEIKKASPSKGEICPGLDVAHIAVCYARARVSAISVLTEPTFFKGSLDDLAIARRVVELPMLRKDFIIDPYQVYEARLYGADAILLIAAILQPDKIEMLRDLAHSLGMAAIVEIHNRAELEVALASGAELVGINNRNLADFTVDLQTTFDLLPLLPSTVTVVSESGIKTHKDIEQLRLAGVHAVLVGESLVTSSDPGAKIEELMGSAVN